MQRSLLVIGLLLVNLSLLHAQAISPGDSTIIPAAAQKNAQSEMIENIKKGFLGHPLADFSFKDVNKNHLSKKELEGKVIVVNFWFTACKPCIEEIPLLNEVVTSYKDKGVVFIAPGLDEASLVNKFLVKHPFNYQVVANQTAYADKMKVEVFPTHLITDKKGIIKQVVIGYHADIKDQLGKAIDWLLQ